MIVPMQDHRAPDFGYLTLGRGVTVHSASCASLLRMLIGLLPPEAGEIRWQGQSIRTLGDDYRADLCYLGHLNAIKEELTPLENLLASAHLADEDLAVDFSEVTAPDDRVAVIATPCRRAKP